MARYVRELLGFPGDGSARKVPALPGFITNPMWRMRPAHAAYTRGVYVTAVQADHTEWSVGIGVGTRPSDNTSYIRTLYVSCDKDDETKTPMGFVMDGDPIHASLVCGKGLAFHKCDEAPESTLMEAWTIVQSVLELLRIRGDLLGNHLQKRNAIRDCYDSGLIDRVVIEATRGTHMEFLKRNHPDSLELVSDLDFEIGTGISQFGKYVEAGCNGFSFNKLSDFHTGFVSEGNDVFSNADLEKMSAVITRMCAGGTAILLEVSTRLKRFKGDHRPMVQSWNDFYGRAMAPDVNHAALFCGNGFRACVKHGTRTFYYWSPDRKLIAYRCRGAISISFDSEFFSNPDNPRPEAWDNSVLFARGRVVNWDDYV